MRRFGLLCDERGNILIVTLLILFGVSVIGSAVAALSSMDLKISSNRYAHAQALYAAEAGLNEAIHRLSLPNPTEMTVGGWVGNVAIADEPPYDPKWRVRVYLTNPAKAPLAGTDVTTGTVQNPDSPYITYSTADGDDGVLTIEHKWDDRDGDGIREADEIVRYDPSRIPSENFRSGRPVEVITVTGTKAQARRTIQAEVVLSVGGAADAARAANTAAAIYGGDGLRFVKKASVCGYNHDVNMPPGLTPNACEPFHMKSGHLPGVAGTKGASMELNADDNIAGFPAPTWNRESSIREPWKIIGVSRSTLGRMLKDADHTFVEDEMDGVSYFRNDCVIDRPVKGSGLLYVEGNLDIRSDFEWQGLVYANGKIAVRGDHCWVLGGVAGKREIVWQSDEAGVLYSADAFRLIPHPAASEKAAGGRVTVLSWREI